MKFSYFIWDYDGTLFDTYDAVARAYHRAAQQNGIEIAFDELRWLTKHSLGWAAKQLEQRYGTAACREALEQKGVEVTVVEKDGNKVLQKMPPLPK